MKLKDYIQAEEISPNKFAKLSGIPQPTVWRIINDKNCPSIGTAAKIQKAPSGKVRIEDLCEKPIQE